MAINLNISVPAIDKLLDIGVNVVLDPLTAKWRVRREVEANTIRALGEAHIKEILAIGEAKAELEAQKVLDVAEAPLVLASEIYDDIERRVLLLLDRRLENISGIVGKARRALPAGEVPDVEPDMAWTSSFSSAAQDISDEDMQELWARVLAGEVARQGSTSIRTLNVLRNLDQRTAQLFKRMCSMAVSLSLPEEHCLFHHVVSLGGDAAQGSLRGFGIPYDTLNVLNEYGLINGDYNAWCDYRGFIGLPGNLMPGRLLHSVIKFQGEKWALIADPERYDPNEEVRVNGVSLSRAGRELSEAVEPEPVPKYVEALKGYFAENGLDMVQV